VLDGQAERLGFDEHFGARGLDDLVVDFIDGFRTVNIATVKVR
jgi:hypothetical protein